MQFQYPKRPPLPSFYESDRERLKRVLSAARAKPPRRVFLRRWLFWLMIATLTIQGVAIVLLKWDASVCRLLNY